MFDWLMRGFPFYANDNLDTIADITQNQQTNITQWACDKGHQNFERSGNVTGICRVCGDSTPEIRSKPHYKWSWKLNKAVRL